MGLTLAECAIVLIHEESILAVKITLELWTDRFVLFHFLPLVIFSRIGWNNRGGMGIILAGTHRTTTLILNKLTIQPTVRQLWANLVRCISDAWRLQIEEKNDIREIFLRCEEDESYQFLGRQNTLFIVEIVHILGKIVI